MQFEPSLHFQVLTELPEIVALTSEWESLLAQSTCNRGFGSVHWFVAACRANPSLRPHVVVARRGKTLTGLLPLVLDEDTATFANYLTDYNDAIAAAKDLETIAALLRFACSQPNGYTNINLKHLRPDSVCLQAVNFLSQENDFKYTFRETLICYYLQLQATHDAFLQSKDSRFRKRLKRLQALADNAGLTAAELDPASFNSSELPDLFLSLHLARRNVKSCFELSAAQNFVIEMMPPLFEKRAIRACVLRNGGRIVAIDLYTMGHNSLCVWNGGFLDEFGYCSPGKLLINEGIKLACALKVDEFDFLRGGEVYKESWVNSSRYIGQLQFVL